MSKDIKIEVKGGEASAMEAVRAWERAEKGVAPVGPIDGEAENFYYSARYSRTFRHCETKYLPSWQTVYFIAYSLILVSLYVTEPSGQVTSIWSSFSNGIFSVHRMANAVACILANDRPHIPGSGVLTVMV